MRTKQQDYVSFIHFGATEFWTLMTDKDLVPDAEKTAVIMLLIELGLRFPSEHITPTIVWRRTLRKRLY